MVCHTASGFDLISVSICALTSGVSLTSLSVSRLITSPVSAFDITRSESTSVVPLFRMVADTGVITILQLASVVAGVGVGMVAS